LWPDDDPNANVTQLPSLEGVKVLLVDDDQDTLKMLTTLLTEHEAVVQTASTTADALEAFQWFKPDVVVSDLAMPGEDGFSLIAKLKTLATEAGRQMPAAVALTAYVRVEDRTRALSAGFNMFVPKPIQPVELITAIANLVEAGATELLLADSEVM
jgi:CheY-like chemotaxis protein